MWARHLGGTALQGQPRTYMSLEAMSKIFESSAQEPAGCPDGAGRRSSGFE